MVPFLIGLLAIVSAFAQGGQPDSTPPHTSDEVKLRGEVVSEAAVALDPSAEEEVSEIEAPTEEEEAPSGDEESEGEVLGAEEDAIVSVEAEVKVAAYNTKSGKEMPTLLPKVAVDNSVALEEAGIPTPTVAPGETETEGEEEDSSGTDSENNGKAFGQATADSAKNKRN